MSKESKPKKATRVLIVETVLDETSSDFGEFGDAGMPSSVPHSLLLQSLSTLKSNPVLLPPIEDWDLVEDNPLRAPSQPLVLCQMNLPSWLVSLNLSPVSCLLPRETWRWVGFAEVS